MICTGLAYQSSELFTNLFEDALSKLEYLKSSITKLQGKTNTKSKNEAGPQGGGSPPLLKPKYLASKNYLT